MLIKYVPPELSVRPESFGARGDGVNNDAPACQAAIDEAAAGCGLVQFTPGRNYKLNSGLVIDTDNQIVMAHGAKFTINFAGVGITIGRVAGGLSQRNCQWYGGWIDRTTDFTSGNIGMRLLNLGHSAVYDLKIFGFEKGLELLGDGDGTRYVTCVPAEIGYCKYGIALIARNAGGYCNSNTFMGNARVGYYSGQPNSAGGYALYLNREVTSENILNQNQFYGLSLEDAMSTGKPSGAIYANCTSCLFHNLSYDGFASPKIEGDLTDFSQNHFIGGDSLLEAATDINLPAGNNPRAMHYEGPRSTMIVGGATNNPCLILRECADGSQAIVELRNTDGVPYLRMRAIGGISQKAFGVFGQWDGAVFTGSKTWQPTEIGQAAGTIRAGKAATTIVTITAPGGATGAAPQGDPCLVGFTQDIGLGAGKDEQGLIWSAQIASDLAGGNNRARVVAFNPGPLDITGIPSGTVKVHARQATIG